MVCVWTQSLRMCSEPPEPCRSISCRWPNSPGSDASEVTWRLPVAPLANSRIISAESSATSNDAPSGRGARGTRWV